MFSARKLMTISMILTGLGGLLHLCHPSYLMLVGIYFLWGFTSLFAFWPEKFWIHTEMRDTTSCLSSWLL